MVSSVNIFLFVPKLHILVSFLRFYIDFTKLQVPTVILINTQDLWDVKPCWLLNSYWHSKGALCFHHKGQAVFLDFVGEALHSFSVLVAICRWTCITSQNMKVPCWLKYNIHLFASSTLQRNCSHMLFVHIQFCYLFGRERVCIPKLQG